MPLTTSHAIAAWPITRLFPALPLAAVVIGCMAPDFEYLKNTAPHGRNWHSMPELFTIAVPAGLLVWLVWRFVVRPAVRTVVPPGLARGIGPARLTIRESLSVIAGVTIGAVSHSLWDGVTHRDGWGPDMFHILRTRVTMGDFGRMPLSRVLQHVSTLAGGALLITWFALWWFSRPRELREFAPGQFQRMIQAATFIFVSAAAAAAYNSTRAPQDIEQFLWYAAVGWMLGAAAALLLWSILCRMAPAGLRAGVLE